MDDGGSFRELRLLTTPIYSDRGLEFNHHQIQELPELTAEMLVSFEQTDVERRHRLEVFFQ